MLFITPSTRPMLNTPKLCCVEPVHGIRQHIALIMHGTEMVNVVQRAKLQVPLVLFVCKSAYVERRVQGRTNGTDHSGHKEREGYSEPRVAQSKVL